jgi:uncharacterized RmlC-like cupin family protein
MNAETHASARCRVVRAPVAYEGKQGPSYAGGVSAESVGASSIWLGVIIMPPGGRTKAHYHADHETAIYVLSGECDLWFGDQLEEHEVATAGDFIFIPAGVSHVAVNRSDVEPFVVIGGRSDPDEQESVVLQPELESAIRSGTGVPPIRR